jgi:hypothetical protein
LVHNVKVMTNEKIFMLKMPLIYLRMKSLKVESVIKLVLHKPRVGLVGIIA